MIISPINARTKAILRRTEEIVFTVLLYPAYLLFSGIERLERATWPPEQTWQRWFAWYPVRVGLGIDAPLVWLEWVERTKYCHYPLYKRFGDTAYVPPWMPSPEEG